MMRETKGKQAAIFYIIGFIFLIPIISYYLSIPDILPKQAYIQVVLSGPILIILGLVLFLFYKRKLVGIFFLLIGIWWVINIIYELAIN